jgi:hypothetical protein
MGSGLLGSCLGGLQTGQQGRCPDTSIAMAGATAVLCFCCIAALLTLYPSRETWERRPGTQVLGVMSRRTKAVAAHASSLAQGLCAAHASCAAQVLQHCPVSALPIGGVCSAIVWLAQPCDWCHSHV